MAWVGKNRSDFYAVAALTMRRILLDRTRYIWRSGMGMHRVDLDDDAYVSIQRGPDVIALDDPLTELMAFYLRHG